MLSTTLTYTETYLWRSLHIAAVVLGLAGCGGGGGAGGGEPSTGSGPVGGTVADRFDGWGTARPTLDVRPNPVSTTCGGTISPQSPTFQAVGDFKVYQGDCVASLTLSAEELRRITDGDGLFDPQPFAKRFSATYRDAFDFLLLVLDHPGAPPTFLYSGRYVSLNTRVPERVRRLLGVVVLPFAVDPRGNLNAIVGGPLLHELMHEWGNNGSLPNPEDPAHWGFSSAGGQLGGWHAPSGVERLPDNTFRAKGPPSLCLSALTDAACQPRPSFGTIANGGNSVQYSQLELFLLGFVRPSDLVPIEVALDAKWKNQIAGEFTVTKWSTLSAQDLLANLGSRAPNFVTPQRFFRTATLVLTQKVSLDAATVDALNQSLSGFSSQATPSFARDGIALALHSFTSATSGEGFMRAGGLSQEVR